MFQGKRVAVVCDDNVVAGSRGMSKNVREVVENAFAELNHVVSTTVGVEILWRNSYRP